MCDPVQQGYFLFGHQGLIHLSPRLQGLRTGEGERRRIWLGVARCLFQSIFSSATALRPKILHGYVSSQQQQRQKAWNLEEASPHHPRYYAGRARGRGFPLTSTYLPFSNLLVTTPTHPYSRGSLRRHRSSNTTRPPRRCGAQVQCQVNGPMCVVLSNPWTRMTKCKVRLTGSFCNSS